ncbi:MAG: ACT domain-containing protein [Candidatus Woesearchaeota archaeon]
MDIIVSKFGGSSVANPLQLEKVIKILHDDTRRKLVVVSAIGTEQKFPFKVTDILSNLYFMNETFYSHEEKKLLAKGYQYKDLAMDKNELLNHFKSRHKAMISGLGLNNGLISEFMDELNDNLTHPYSLDNVVSLGEKFSAKIISELLGAKFIDPREYIHIGDNNGDNEITYTWMKDLSISELTISPGFYGNASSNKKVLRTKILGRGGSDITGSLYAKGLNAIKYENWTDTNGMYRCDPRLFENISDIEIIDYISQKECRELTYNGFSVLNEETIGPLRNTKIPLVIKNTNNPNHPGTTIVSDYIRTRPVVGIAGRNNFVSITIEKYLMGREVGVGSALLDIFTSKGISFDHTFSGEDSLSLVLNQNTILDREDLIRKEINEKIQPDNIRIIKDQALIAVVGENIANLIGLESEIFSCLSKNNIHVPMITKGPSENSIIFGVKNSDYKKGIVALYNQFFS